MPFIPIIGFSPDVDPTTPGVLLECDGWVPSPRGMRSAYTATELAVDALAAACRGLYISRRVDGLSVLYAGTSTRLYELSSSSWTDRSAGGNAYTTVAAWRFATQGNVTLAASATNKLQAATTGAFATVTKSGTDAPKAAAICTTLGFVMLGNYDTGSAVTDGWFCSALYDYTDWTPAVATQCANGRLLDTPGAITAMRTLNETVIAFKDRSCYQGVFQGPPTIWAWRLLSNDIGSVSQEATVDLAHALAWVGHDGIWVMDGAAVPQRIDAGIREWFYARLDRANAHKIQGLYDRERQLIYWFYPVKNGDSSLTAWIAWNVQTKRWGAGSLSIEWAAETLTTSQTYDSYFPQFSSWDSLPALPYDSTAWYANVLFPTVVNAAHTLSYLGGVSGTSTLRVNRYGDEGGITLMRRVSPRWSRVPQDAALVNGFAADTGEAMTNDASVSMSAKNRFDFTRAARWHDFQLTTLGDAEVQGLHLDYRISGRE